MYFYGYGDFLHLWSNTHNVFQFETRRILSLKLKQKAKTLLIVLLYISDELSDFFCRRFCTNLAAEIVDSCLGQMSDFFYCHFTRLNCMLFHIIKNLSLIWNNQSDFGDWKCYFTFAFSIFYFLTPKLNFFRCSKLCYTFFIAASLNSTVIQTPSGKTKLTILISSSIDFVFRFSRSRGPLSR